MASVRRAAMVSGDLASVGGSALADGETGLAGYGLGPGSPLAVLTPDGFEGWTGELAALACGASSIPLDPDLPRDLLRDTLSDSSAAVALVSTPEVLERVREIRADLDLNTGVRYRGI